MRVYKFLPAEFALSNIEHSHIKISRVADLNDPFELRPVSTSRRPELRRVLDSWRQEMDRQHGLLCFTASWQNPVLWSHYAQKHRGICLSYDLDDSLVERVRYRGKRIAPRFDNQGGLIRDEPFAQDMLFTKYKRWGYEQEVRVWVSLDPATKDAAGHYFYDYNDKLALREVILGPLFAGSVSKVRRRVKSKAALVHVIKARLAFSSFKIVEDRLHRALGSSAQASRK